MPVKKNTNQNSPASKKGKKISKEQRESIKQAVDSLSGMVTTFPVEKEIRPQAPQTPPTLRTTKSIPSRYHNKLLEEKKRKIVWISVSLLMIIISCVWVYSLRIQVKNSGFGTGSDSTLWETAKFDYSQILKPLKEIPSTKPTSTDPVTYEESERIKEILAQNILYLEQTSTSTSSTTEIATSTPSETPSTTEKIVTTTKK